MAGVKSYFLAPFLLATAGCAVTPVPTALLSPPPLNYREIILTRAHQAFPDPYSIREALISAPFIGNSQLGASSTICVRADYKDGKGTSPGPRPVSFTFRSGELVDIDFTYSGPPCAQAKYEPFPELEALRKHSPDPSAKRAK